MSFYTQDELKQLGFKKLGKNVSISKKASLYGISRISIGDNSRIDDFCVLSSSGVGEIKIGKHVHIAVYSSLIGQADIIVDNYASISSRVSIYSSSDDYSGEFMTNPTISSEYTNVESLPVIISRHVIIGSGTVILPGVILEDGVAVGALSLVTNSATKNTIIAGIPAKTIKMRKTNYLELEKKL